MHYFIREFRTFCYPNFSQTLALQLSLYLTYLIFFCLSNQSSHSCQPTHPIIYYFCILDDGVVFCIVYWITNYSHDSYTLYWFLCVPWKYLSSVGISLSSQIIKINLKVLFEKECLSEEYIFDLKIEHLYWGK